MINLIRTVAAAFLAGIVIWTVLGALNFLVGAALLLLKGAVLLAAGFGLVYAYRLWRLGRHAQTRPARDERGLNVATRLDLHLLRHLGYEHQVDDVLRRHGLLTRAGRAAAQAYLGLLEREPRLDLLSGVQGAPWRPASDAGDLLPFTGVVTLEELQLDPAGTQHGFTVLDEHGRTHRLHHWQADFLTPAGSA